MNTPQDPLFQLLVGGSWKCSLGPKDIIIPPPEPEQRMQRILQGENTYNTT